MTNEDIKLGSVVYSKSGRDSGRYYAAVKLEPNFAYIADGKSRRVEKPKRKKLMHLRAKGAVLDAIAEKLAAGKPVHNKELMAALRPHNREEE